MFVALVVDVLTVWVDTERVALVARVAGLGAIGAAGVIGAAVVVVLMVATPLHTALFALPAFVQS